MALTFFITLAALIINLLLNSDRTPQTVLRSTLLNPPEVGVADLAEEDAVLVIPVTVWVQQGRDLFLNKACYQHLNRPLLMQAVEAQAQVVLKAEAPFTSIIQAEELLLPLRSPQNCLSVKFAARKDMKR